MKAAAALAPPSRPGWLATLFGARAFLALLALLALSMLVWFAGPLVSVAGRAPLIGVEARLWTIAAMTLVAALAIGSRVVLARRREALLLAALAAENAAPAEDPAIAGERAVLQEKMQSAVATLRSRSAARGRDGRFVYELPWYAIIGPPGAGKTTLLANSGLEFPLEETHGRHSIKGVGGTRDCDWWFTDDAVLLDTAGRYATQDSDASVDSAGWTAFLALLKEARPRRPLNGLLLALSVQDVLGADGDTLADTAQRLRTRVDELQQALGVTLPVYLLLTKCDLLAGFDAFFADSDAAAREQVWGFTLPLPGERREDGETAPTIAGELEALVTRLHDQTLGRLHDERGTERREAIYTLPLQFAALARASRVLGERFAARSRLVDDVRLRGLYFTSATQTGGVLDEVIARVAAGVGLPPAVSGAPASAGRSYFIRGLLERVVFPEAGLVGTDRRTERRLARLQGGAIVATVLALVAVLGLWWSDWLTERSRLEGVATRADTLQRALATLSPDSLDLVETTRVLELARTLDERDGEAGRPLLLGGFGASASVAPLADDKYAALLTSVLLPRLMTRLEHRLSAEAEDDDFLFEGLKTYLMIGDPSRFDPAAVIGWFRYDLVANLPASTSRPTREALVGHIERLFAQAPSPLPRPLDAALIERLREIAARLPLEQRAWARLKGSAREALGEHLSLVGLSPELPRLFTREGGGSLDEAVPRLYTVEGYRDDFLPLVDGIAERLADERWVLGDRFVAPDVDASTLDTAVRRQYEAAYVTTWRSLLDTVRLRPVDGLDGAARTISQLTAADSPLALFLREAARQTAPLAALQRSLGGADEEARGAAASGEASDAADDGAVAAARRAAELAALLGPRDTAPIAAGSTPEDRVAARFDALHALVASTAGGGSPLDGALAELAGLNTQLLAMANGAAAGDPALARELGAGLQALGFRTERLAEPLASLVGELAGDIRDAAGSGLCRELENAWKSEVLPFWTRAIRGRYPVYRGALADIALADFAAFFGPSGRLQTFANTRLASLVTRSPARWTWNGAGESCLADESLRQLALGDDIRDTFFAAGGAVPSFAFDLVPSTLGVDPAISLVQLQIGAARMDYFHGPLSGTSSFVWPDPAGALQASLRVEPVVPGGSSGIATSGPWAVLRLFEQGARSRRDGGLGVDYSFSGRAVSLSFATSSFNPLDSVALRNFRAPDSL